MQRQSACIFALQIHNTNLALLRILLYKYTIRTLLYKFTTAHLALQIHNTHLALQIHNTHLALQTHNPHLALQTHNPHLALQTHNTHLALLRTLLYKFTTAHLALQIHNICVPCCYQYTHTHTGWWRCIGSDLVFFSNFFRNRISETSNFARFERGRERER